MNLPLSTYSFFSRNFLFTFRLSYNGASNDREGRKEGERCRIGDWKSSSVSSSTNRNANIRVLTVLGNQVEILSVCREPLGGNHFRKESAKMQDEVRGVIKRSAVLGRMRNILVEYICVICTYQVITH